MLRDKAATATVAVRDIEAASRFYETTLGLKAAKSEEPSVRAYDTGGATLLVYESQFAGTNKATAVTWTVGKDLDGIVATLKERGIVFEHYDMPGLKREGEVHVGGGMRVAWFKDPDGNIHALASR
jgi:catechol 2,3-dioxygenase-like lactoylglutathione lyase family enzyme